MTKNTIRYVPCAPRAAWSAMPDMTASSLRHAVIASDHAAAALVMTQAALLVVHAHGIDGRRRATTATLWTEDGDGFVVDAAGSRINPGMLADIGGAIGEMVREIAARWPANARPRTIGIAFDGNAMAFNASYPGAEGCEWLDEHLHGRAPAALLRDGGRGGMLTRLCPRTA